MGSIKNAVKLDKTLQAEQQKDVFLVDPTWIKRGYNSTIHPEPNEKAENVTRAIDIFHNGQQQACIVRKLDGGELELVAGFGRLESVTMLRNGFEFGGESYKDEGRKLLVRIDESLKTEAQAFEASIRENVRKSISDINKAAAQEVLRKDYGYTETKIAELYGYNNVNAVSRLKKLLLAPKEVQERIHKGGLTTDAALKLLSLPKGEQEKLLASGEKITGPKVVEAVAAYKEAKEEPVAGAAPKGDTKEPAAPSANRNVAAFKKFIAGYIDRELDGVPLSDTAPLTYKLLKGIEEFFKGVGQEPRLWNRVEALINLESPAEAPKKR